jgi:hypothetical protein
MNSQTSLERSPAWFTSQSVTIAHTFSHGPSRKACSRGESSFGWKFSRRRQ